MARKQIASCLLLVLAVFIGCARAPDEFKEYQASLNAFVKRMDMEGTTYSELFGAADEVERAYSRLPHMGEYKLPGDKVLMQVHVDESFEALQLIVDGQRGIMEHGDDYSDSARRLVEIKQAKLKHGIQLMSLHLRAINRWR